MKSSTGAFSFDQDFSYSIWTGTASISYSLPDNVIQIGAGISYDYLMKKGDKIFWSPGGLGQAGQLIVVEVS